ncbi:peptidoglycan DD-metalloendopeptidase family protein [Actinomyces ruminicola]|uniref:peptidoglycan DD-metalloendopeptidase family protein n=1 Tax=Actinomyces ruminicola TaxID=332524 RepID=UPI0011CC5503|nr:peptidoglycan DD-metalloendopeptidase family protein [Actinomyces ruminicola]
MFSVRSPLQAGSSRRRRARRARRAVATVAALVLAAAPLYAGAQADERQDAVDDQAAAQRKQAELAASLEGVSAELGQAYIELQNAQASLDTAQTELDSAEAVLAQKEREQQTAANRLAVAESQLATLKEQAEQTQTTVDENTTSVADLVVATYQGDSAVTSWTYVLASDSVDELTDRASTMEIATGVQESVLSAAEQERVQAANRQARQDATTERVSTLKAEADAAKTAAQTAKDTAKTKRDEVAALKAEKATAASNLESQKADLEKQQAQAAADEEAAAAKIAELDAANRASAGYTGSSSGAGASSSLGSGAIGHPIAGPLIVASPFGYRIHPITGERRLHAGVDLVASSGTPQYAGVAGTVTHNINSSCGNGVFINGGVINGQSVVLAYCHLSAISVPNGATVTRGQTIGLTGMTGGATGPHVHFEVILNGTEVDPMTLPGF